MIGCIRLTIGDGTQIDAVLEDDGVWHCEAAPEFADNLNHFYGADSYSPADGQFGQLMVARAALAARAEITYLEPVKPGRPGAVY